VNVNNLSQLKNTFKDVCLFVAKKLQIKKIPHARGAPYVAKGKRA
jgi:hypothetical protein